MRCLLDEVPRGVVVLIVGESCYQGELGTTTEHVAETGAGRVRGVTMLVDANTCWVPAYIPVEAYVSGNQRRFIQVARKITRLVWRKRADILVKSLKRSTRRLQG
jgi:hypothetical protein